MIFAEKLAHFFWNISLQGLFFHCTATLQTLRDVQKRRNARDDRGNLEPSENMMADEQLIK